MPPVETQTHVQQPQGETCGRCGHDDIQHVQWIWWGGVLAPKMYQLRKCRRCGYEFNGKTGASTRNAFIAYNLVVFGIILVLVLGFLFLASRA